MRRSLAFILVLLGLGCRMPFRNSDYCNPVCCPPQSCPETRSQETPCQTQEGRSNPGRPETAVLGQPIAPKQQPARVEFREAEEIHAKAPPQKVIIELPPGPCAQTQAQPQAAGPQCVSPQAAGAQYYQPQYAQPQFGQPMMMQAVPQSAPVMMQTGVAQFAPAGMMQSAAAQAAPVGNTTQTVRSGDRIGLGLKRVNIPLFLPNLFTVRGPQTVVTRTEMTASQAQSVPVGVAQAQFVQPTMMVSQPQFAAVQAAPQMHMVMPQAAPQMHMVAPQAAPQVQMVMPQAAPQVQMVMPQAAPPMQMVMPQAAPQMQMVAPQQQFVTPQMAQGSPQDCLQALAACQRRVQELEAQAHK